MLFISQAFAANEQVAQSPLSGLVPIFIIFFIFYFLLIRPQQKKIKQHNQMIDAVTKGDSIVTSGGVVGKVVKIVDDKILHVEIANDVVIQVLKSTLSNVNDIKFAALTAKEAAKTKKTTSSKTKKK